MRLLINICILFFGLNLIAQNIPSSIGDKMLTRAFNGVRPSDETKSLFEKVHSIKVQVLERQESRSPASIQGEILSDCRNLGYNQQSIDAMEASFENHDIKTMYLNMIKFSKAEDVLRWSGYEVELAEEGYSNSTVVAYGTEHSKYDPEKDFWTDSRFEANSFQSIAPSYQFDYWMKIHFDAGFQEATVDLWVNSKDGSFGFIGDEAAPLLRGSATGGSQVDFVIANVQGRGIAFMPGSDGLEANKLESMPMLLAIIGYTGNPDKDAEYNETIMESNQLEALYDSDLADRLDISESTYKCFEYEQDDHSPYRFCLQRQNYPIYTLMPRLGIGVGVFKDYVSESNHLILKSTTSSQMGFPITATLLDFEERDYTFNASPYLSNQYHDTKLTRKKIKRIEKEIDEKEAERENVEKLFEEEKLSLKETLITSMNACGSDASCRQIAKDRYQRLNTQAFERYKAQIESIEDQIDQKLTEIKQTKKTGQ